MNMNKPEIDNRTFREIFNSMNETVKKGYGRLLTKEEAIELTEKIRKELREEENKK